MQSVIVKALKVTALIAVSCAAAYAGCALADQDLGNLAAGVTGSFANIGKLMLATSYLAGIGFAIAAIFKFKQHRDNPTQIPIGTPITLLAVGVVLIFLPGIIKPAGQTLLGSGGSNAAGGFTGAGTTALPGS